ncbi:MAG TPA: acyl-CoA synthetase [Aquabacterium sp.]|nr:acyl-CoA synthetase [Aquabacterium sp.]
MTAPRQLPEWMQRKERGNLLALRVMTALSLGLGRRLSRVIVVGISLYFLVAAQAARRASRAYLTRCLGRRPTWRELFRHMFTFATTVHDRLYLLNDRAEVFDVHCVGEAPGGAAGGFLFGAHLGSFEVLRAAARWDARDKVCVAMYPENARQINQALAAINPQAVSNIIPLGQMDSILSIHDKLQDGAMVGILADRAAGQDQYVSVPFLGAPASFPVGPFRLAAMMGCPVYFMAGLYQGGNRYDVHFELLMDTADKAGRNRDTLMRELLARYVAALERHCRQAPYNWFNFYDFWGDPHLGAH